MKAGSRQRHGSRKLIEKVFQGAGKGATFSTAQVFEGVNKVAGAKVPEYSVRSALRTLLKRKALTASKRGRELYYRSVGASANRAPSRKSPEPEVVVESAPILAVTGSGIEVPVGAVAVAVERGPHKLAVGEALILHIGDEHVEAVTNVHGKLVVERHPRRK
ncbi:MAG TPA: hypothetical protein VN083_11430 [Vicinamibacteria bacterium]|nr:hypothetical protein [Vicinamibacteria bacterium]